MAGAFFNTSGIWEVSNHDVIYPSGLFATNRINPDCGGCFDLYTDFTHEEIYNGSNPGYWIRDYANTNEYKALSVGRLLENFNGRSGVFQPASGFLPVYLDPCSLTIEPSPTFNCKGLDARLEKSSVSGYLIEFDIFVDRPTYRPVDMGCYDLSKGYAEYALYSRGGGLGPLTPPEREEIFISSLSFTGENINIGLGSGVLYGSGDWASVTNYRDNFWRVYPSGEYYPDAFPSGLSRHPIIYAIDRFTYDGQEVYQKICQRPIVQSYNSAVGSLCTGTPGEASGYLDYVTLDGPSQSIAGNASGQFIYDRAGQVFESNGFLIAMASGVYLDNLHIKSLGCDPPCGVVTPITEYDKFFNKPQPIIKYHYLTSASINSSSNALYNEPPTQTICPSGSWSYGCFDTGTENVSEYFEGEWETAILNPIDDTYYESDEITVSRTVTIPAFSYSHDLGGWEIGVDCGDIVEAAIVPTDATVDSVTITQDIKFKCRAELQGDTNLHFFIEYTTPIFGPAFTQPRVLGYEIYPKRILAPYFGLANTSKTKDTTGTIPCIEYISGLGINSTITQTSASGNAYAEWISVPSGYIEFDWTP